MLYFATFSLLESVFSAGFGYPWIVSASSASFKQRAALPFSAVNALGFAQESTGFGTDLILSVGAEGRLIPATLLYRGADHVMIAGTPGVACGNPGLYCATPTGLKSVFSAGSGFPLDCLCVLSVLQATRSVAVLCGKCFGFRPAFSLDSRCGAEYLFPDS